MTPPASNGQACNVNDFLLAEYAHFADSFWRNEEVGEKRVTFLITLVTACGGALVAFHTKMQNLNQGQADFLEELTWFALAALLLLGLSTLKRILKRNKVTDEYKLAMDAVRSRFRDAGLLPPTYQPIGKGLLATIPLPTPTPERADPWVRHNLLTELRQKGIDVPQDTPVESKAGGWRARDFRRRKAGTKGCRKPSLRAFAVWVEQKSLRVYDLGKLRPWYGGGLVTTVIVINCLLGGMLTLAIGPRVSALTNVCNSPFFSDVLFGLVGFVLVLFLQYWIRRCSEQ